MKEGRKETQREEERRKLTHPHRPENVSQDLESFAKHAGRSTVTTDDVLLITRRNDALQEIVKEFIETDKNLKKKKPVDRGR
jgi:centromere protein S